MAGVSRHMGRSMVCAARAVERFCGSKAVGGGMSSAAGMGFGAGASAGRSAPSARSMLRDCRRPGTLFARLPGEVAMIQSLLPLHNATASAQMVSQLRSSAGALLQGTHMDIS